MNIQLYATKVITEAERDTSNVYLEGVDGSQVLAEFSPQELVEYVLDNHYDELISQMPDRSNDCEN